MPETIRVGPLELRFLRDKHDTRGGLDMFEMLVPPGGQMPVAHYHRNWDETAYGLEGTITFTVDGMPHPLAPGDSLFIPRGVVHGFDNRSGAPARCLAVLTPGVLGPEYFRELASLVAHGPPDEAVVKEVMLRHGLVPAGSAQAA
ncbi:MAG TPA: cupin domain-containing protein [Acetobacteraceae bacterium]